jgi:hypothetical protein
MVEPLPLCPCESGKLYEECCYTIQLPDGSRRFFDGLMTRESDDKPWHPFPNARLQAVLIGEMLDEFRQTAMAFSRSTKLSEPHRKTLADRLAGFLRAYADLKEYLAKPQARGVSMSMTSTELTGLWWQYISTARTLLDFVGYRSRSALQLKSDISGLSRKKLPELRRALSRDPQLAGVLSKVDLLAPTLLDLIDVRDREKVEGGTILEAPSISPEGKSWGGVVKVSKLKDVDFCQFLDESYAATVEFARVILAT